MLTIKKISIFFLSLFVLSSCSDLLNVDPTSVITTDSFWKSENDAQGAAIGMYIELRNQATNNLYHLGESRADVVTLGTVGEGGWSKYYYNNLHPADAGPTWQGFYTLINSANLIIKYVPDIEFASEDKKNRILAEAYTMRAYTYFVMARTWGDLPLRTVPTESTDAEFTQIPRSPVEEIFDLIKSDLDKALQLYPDNSIPGGRFQWSRPATNALKGDVYLWTGKVMNGGDSDFSTALSALNEIQGSNIELLDDFESIFAFDNKGNNEILMAVRFDEFEGGNNYFRDMYIIGSAIPTNIDPETRSKIGAIGGGSNNIVVPTDYLRSLYSEDDQRKDATYYEIYTNNDQGGKNYYTSIVTKGSGTVIGGSRQFKDDVILYRYGEVLLLIAEAKNALGQDPSEEMNAIRMRAYGDDFQDYAFTSGSQAENDEEILEERLRELAFEGKRWWDLLRFGKALEYLPTLENQQHMLLWPISNGVLSLENKVTQNPGY